jgi:hypothetical protein
MRHVCPSSFPRNKKPARWFWGQRAGVSFDCDYLRGYLEPHPHAGTLPRQQAQQQGRQAQVRWIMPGMLPNLVFPVKSKPHLSFRN